MAQEHHKPEPQIDTESRRRQWLARAALAAVLAAIVVLVVFAGFKTLLVFLATVGALVIGLASVFWFLTVRGRVRWLALAVAVVIPIALLFFLVNEHLLWVVLVVLALAMLATACARAALVRDRDDWMMPEREVPPPKHPFVVMNPRSGGGKVEKFDLRGRAEALGVEVAMLDGPEIVDIAALTRQAVARGADLLGVAGGDGTQALVAGIAAEHDLPFLVISAGTRNHFALDLGLDREDPASCLDALTDGVEVRVDLGSVNGRTFVNNASFGAYAEVVQSPAYRDDKTGTMLAMLPDLISGARGPRLFVRTGEVTITEPQAVLVSNGAYEMHDLAGMGRRPRLDTGTLGIVVVSVSTTLQAVGLLRRTRQHGLTQHTGPEVVVDADQPQIPVGVDGEALVLSTPVQCTIRPQALRVRVPRNRPGVRPPKRPLDWVRLRQLAWL